MSKKDEKPTELLPVEGAPQAAATPVAELPEATAEAPKKEKAPKAAKPVKEKVERDIKNGIPRPLSGATARIWQLADEMSSKLEKPVERKEIMDVCLAEGMTASTIATQYGRWCKYYGIKKRAVTPVATESAPPESAEA